MRQIGLLETEADAERLAAYLVTEGIAAQAESDGDGWAIWVRDENHLERARQEFADFRHNPNDPRYQGVERAAESMRREEERRRERARKNVVTMRGRWGRLSARRRPLVLTMIALSVFVGMASNMGKDQNGGVMRTLLFCSAEHLRNLQWNQNNLTDRLIDVRHGELWRLITPIFVHYGSMHLAFNMVMFYQLGSLIEDRRGTWRFGLMTLAIAALSNGAQALVPIAWGGSPFAAGMSGVVYGLFGYVWMKTLYAPELGLYVSRTTVVILMAWLLLGIAGALDSSTARIANWAHAVGFLAGVAIGYLPEAWKIRV
jgi:GlpG protein